jgi:hypothetical protein
MQLLVGFALGIVVGYTAARIGALTTIGIWSWGIALGQLAAAFLYLIQPAIQGGQAK